MRKREEERLYKTLFERMESTILWIVREDHLILEFASHNAYQKLGISPKDIHSKSIMDFVHMVDRPSVLKSFNLAREVKNVVIQHRFFNKADQSVWFQTELSFDEKSREYVGVSQDVSDIKGGFANVDSLKESDKLRGIFQFSTDLVCIAGTDGIFKEINPAFEKTLGYSEKELLLTSFVDFVHPDDVVETMRTLSAIKEGHVVKDFENRYRKKDGTYIWLSWMGHPIPGTELIYGIARDVSEKKKNVLALENLVKETSSELMQSRDFLNLVIENVPHLMFVKDAKDLRFVHFNKAGEELLGLTKSELLGKTAHDLFPKEQADFFVQKDREALERKKLINISEEKLDTKTGTKYLRTMKVPLLNEKGEPIYLLGFSEDITEWKKNEKIRLEIVRDQTLSRERALNQEKALFLANVSSVLSSSLDFHMTLDKLAKIIVPFLGDWCSILIVKEDGTIERAAVHHRNENMRSLLDELLKYPAQRTILNSLHFQDVIRTGKSFVMDDIDEKSLKDLFLDEKHTEILKKLSIHAVMGVPIVYGERIHGAIAIVLSEKNRKFDQQDLMTAEEIGRKAGVAIENALLYRTAQNAIAARDEFLSIASHELKTPITSLKLLMQMTRKTVKPESGAMPNPDKMAQLLDQASQQVDRLINLIEALLDVSRIEMGKIFYQFNQLDFSQLVKDLGERYREHLKTFHCELIMEIDEGITITGDRMRIEQVILNLLTNAAKYGEKRPVKMRLVRRENKVQLSVQDEGMGIPPDKLEKIFDRFERIDQESNISGLGLGLYISREIVLAHMGRIWGESEIGKGSTFYVELPIYKNHLM